MAYLFTRWFLTYAKNASQYIDVAEIGCTIEGISKVDQERLSKRGSYKSELKGLISGESTNTVRSDGTINFDAINKQLNSYTTEIDSNSAMNNISIKLYDIKNNKFERNIERLENVDEVLDDEEENFNEMPDKIVEKTTSSKEKINTKMSFTNTSFRDFRNLLIS